MYGIFTIIYLKLEVPHLGFLDHYLSSDQSPGMTFHDIRLLIGIFVMAYYNLYVTG